MHALQRIPRRMYPLFSYTARFSNASQEMKDTALQVNLMLAASSGVLLYLTMWYTLAGPLHANDGTPST